MAGCYEVALMAQGRTRGDVTVRAFKLSWSLQPLLYSATVTFLNSGAPANSSRQPVRQTQAV